MDVPCDGIISIGEDLKEYPISREWQVKVYDIGRINQWKNEAMVKRCSYFMMVAWMFFLLFH